MSLPNSPEHNPSTQVHVNNHNITSPIPHNRYYPCINTCKCLNISVSLQPFPVDNNPTSYNYNELYTVLQSNIHSPLYSNDIIIGLLDTISIKHCSLLEERCIELKYDLCNISRTQHKSRWCVYRCLNCKIDVISSIIEHNDNSSTDTVNDKLSGKLCGISSRLIYGDDLYRLKNTNVYSDIFHILIRNINKESFGSNNDALNNNDISFYTQRHGYQSLTDAVHKSLSNARVASEQRIAQLQANESNQLMKLERKAKNELASLIKLIESNNTQSMELPSLNLQRNTSHASSPSTRSPRTLTTQAKPQAAVLRTESSYDNNTSSNRNRTQSPTILEHVTANNSPVVHNRLLSISPPQLNTTVSSDNDDISPPADTIDEKDTNVFPLDEDIMFDRSSDSFDDSIADSSIHDNNNTTSDDSPVQTNTSRHIAPYMTMPMQIPIQLTKSPTKTQASIDNTDIDNDSARHTIIPPHTYTQANFWSTEKYRYLPDVERSSRKDIVAHTPNSYAFFNTQQNNNNNNRANPTNLYNKSIDIQSQQNNKPVVSALSMSLRH